MQCIVVIGKMTILNVFICPMCNTVIFPIIFCIWKNWKRNLKMLKLIGIACATGSILFDLASYYKQIAKTLRTRRSSQVSSSAYMLKLSHYTCSVIALILFYNWVGLVMELAALIACLFCFVIVVRCKPKSWKLIDFGK
jgi:hypothetical protein